MLENITDEEFSKMLENITDNLMKDHEEHGHKIVDATTHGSTHRTFYCSCGEVFLKEKLSNAR